MIVYPGDQIASIHTGAWDIDISQDVLSDVAIRHGGQEFNVSTAQMSSAQFTVRVPRDWTNYWVLGQVGNGVRINTVGHRRFTGHITDIDYSWEETSEGWMLMHRVQCVGTIARLGSRLMWNTYWPQETTETRVRNILSSAWSDHPWAVRSGDYNPVKLGVAERDTSRPALGELEDLLFEGEAVLFDRPDGAVIWQQLAARNAMLDIVELPSDAILFAPDFSQQLDLVNSVRMDYGTGDPRPYVEAFQNESRFYQGEWYESYATDYVDQVGAQVKADRIVRRQGWPPVLLPSIEVLLNRLDLATFNEVALLQVGNKVRLPRMPDPYPIGVGPGQSSGVWIVEGWTEYVGSRYNPDDEWRLTLHLSPPIWSMVGKTWDEQEVTGELWQDFPYTTWDEIGEL